MGKISNAISVDGSGLYTWCEVSTQRMVVAYILNNGVSAFFFNGLGLDWTPFN